MIAACSRLLRERFGARRVIPFGSAVAPQCRHPGSDLDLAVEGLPPERFWEAWASLEDVIPPGLSVDLVSMETASPALRARILGGEALAENTLQALQGLIADELETLKKLQTQVERIRNDLPAEAGQTELMALAGYLHGFYTGLEGILERLAIGLGEALPRGEYWHADLLNQMADPQPGRRPPVIDERLRARLREYLRFRHFFRHAYSHELEWVKLRPLVEGMAATFADFREQIEAFLERRAGENG